MSLAAELTHGECRLRARICYQTVQTLIEATQLEIVNLRLAPSIPGRWSGEEAGRRSAKAASAGSKLEFLTPWLNLVVDGSCSH